MPDRVSLITRLILDRPTCLNCIAEKSGMTVSQAGATLDLIENALKIYQELDWCRVCGEAKEVCSLKQRTP
jgi:hypothetical protein